MLFFSNQLIVAQNKPYALQYIEMCLDEVDVVRGALGIDEINYCFETFNPENSIQNLQKSIYFKSSKYTAPTKKPEFYDEGMRIIEHVKAIRYLEEGIKGGNFTLIYVFRKDNSEAAFVFEKEDFCSKSEKKLCVWPGESNTFEIEYQKDNFAYNEVIISILYKLRRTFDTQEIFKRRFYHLK